jgi:hypothetical protein
LSQLPLEWTYLKNPHVSYSLDSRLRRNDVRVYVVVIPVKPVLDSDGEQEARKYNT